MLLKIKLLNNLNADFNLSKSASIFRKYMLLKLPDIKLENVMQSKIASPKNVLMNISVYC